VGGHGAHARAIGEVFRGCGPHMTSEEAVSSALLGTPKIYGSELPFDPATFPTAVLRKRISGLRGQLHSACSSDSTSGAPGHASTDRQKSNESDVVQIRAPD